MVISKTSGCRRADALNRQVVEVAVLHGRKLIHDRSRDVEAVEVVRVRAERLDAPHVQVAVEVGHAFRTWRESAGLVMTMRQALLKPLDA